MPNEPRRISGPRDYSPVRQAENDRDDLIRRMAEENADANYNAMIRAHNAIAKAEDEQYRRDIRNLILFAIIFGGGGMLIVANFH